MKKLIIYLVILSIALCGILGAHISFSQSSATLLDGEGENCPIVETVLAGDPTQLEGWQIDFTLYAGDHLQWDGTYHLGVESQCDTTDFFRIDRIMHDDFSYVSLRIDNHFSADYDETINKFSDHGYGPLLKYANTQLRSNGTLTLSLKDFLNYFPLTLQAYCDLGKAGFYTFDLFDSTNGILYTFLGNSDEYVALQELFRFPVQPEDQAMITVDFAPEQTKFTVTIQTNSYLEYYHMVTQDGIYLLPVYRSNDGGFLKTDHAQGVGVYFIPYQDYGSITVDDKERAAITADIRNAVNICPLGEDAQICFAQFSQEDGTVTLVLLEEDRYIAQIMDLSSGTTLRRVSLTTALSAGENICCMLTGNTLAIRQQDIIFLTDLSGCENTLTIDATGLSIMTTGPSDHRDGHLVLKDGQAVLAQPTGSALLEVMAWDKNGLLFHGKYDYAALDEPHGSPEPLLELFPASVMPSKLS